MKTILFFSTKQNKLDLKSLDNLEDYNIEVFDTTKENLINLFEKRYNKDTFLASDDINFLQIAFRLYNQTFKDFVYIQNKVSPKSFEEFDIFLTTPIDESEKINKSIYILGENTKNIEFKQISTLNETKNLQKTQKKIQKIFHFQNKYFISEFINFDYKIITLDNSIAKENFNLDNFFFYLENNLVKIIKNILKLFDQLSQDIHSEITKMKTILDRLAPIEQQKFIIHFKFLVNNLENKDNKTYIYSFLANLEFFTSRMFNSLILEIKNDFLLSPENKYFLFWQYARINFTKPFEKQMSQRRIWEFYRTIYQEFKKEFQNIEFISKENRNENLIFLFTSQFLGEAHAPTKNILDMAYSLIKDFNKEILIINTAEILTNIGSIPFYNRIVANKVQPYSNTNQILYKDINIPFYQCVNDMPNLNDILNILLIIQEYKPYFILSQSTILTADLASNLLSTVSFPTSSDLTISHSHIHIKVVSTTTEQEQLMKILNIDKESIILLNNWRNEITPFKSTYSKNNFNLPEDKFLLSVIGNRLKDEITDKFITMLLETISYNTHIVFVGIFSNYKEVCDKSPILKENSTYIGYQEHLYNVLKLFDMFVNPPRNGGGTGGIWALMNAVPIITLDYGDVYSLTKPNFGVKSYEEMKNYIIKCATDKQFWQSQSELAYHIYDSSNTVKENLAFILEKLESNPYFK